MNYDLIRDGYGFRETFDAGFDEETCQYDIEGSDIYDIETGEYLGHIDWTLPSDIEAMDDEEFYKFLENNGIF